MKSLLVFPKVAGIFGGPPYSTKGFCVQEDELPTEKKKFLQDPGMEVTGNKEVAFLPG